MTRRVSAEQIDAILPQTQCGLCSFNGCMPYAEALANKSAAIDLCPPGGVSGLIEIAKLVNENPEPFIAEMKKKEKPTLVAVIREAECIGCAKCIKACPVDAILGSAKQMHSVITDECTGCELCVAPCPVDCIDMVEIPKTENKSTQYRKRYYARQQRLATERDAQRAPRQASQQVTEKKDYIQAALLRAKMKKQQTLGK
jgi:electron transport complex protein RnfB